jgi:hypothetical protein
MRLLALVVELVSMPTFAADYTLAPRANGSFGGGLFAPPVTFM